MMNYCPRCAAPLETRQVDDQTRKACSASGCAFVHWDNPIPVVAAVVSLDGNIVLARNANWPVEMFSMITGFVSPGEAPLETLGRELDEELGLELQDAKFLGHHIFAQQNQLIIAFLARCRGPLRLGPEIAETRVLTPTQFSNYDFGPLKLTDAVARQAMAVL